MRKNVMRWTALLMGAVMMIGAAGCGKGGNGSSSKGGDEYVPGELTGELTVQCFINENGTGEDEWQKIFDDFEADNPGLELTVHMGPTVNSELSKTWLSGKNTPDVVVISGKGLSEYALSSAGAFLDLKDWFQTATVYGTDTKIADMVNSEQIEEYEGHLYKMPRSASCYGLWYSETKMQQLGITVHKNFDELMANGKILLNNNMASILYPGQYANYLVWGMIMPAVGAYGQEFFDEVVSGENPEIYKDERFKSVLERLKEVADAGYIAKGVGSLDHLGAQSSWLKYNAAYMATGTWVEDEMKREIPTDFQMKYTAAGLNLADQKPCVPLITSGVAVSAVTKNEANAKAFLSFLYKPEYISGIGSTGSLGVYTDSDAIAPDSYSAVARSVVDYINSDEVTVVYKTNDWGDVGEEMNNVANGLAVGTIKTVDEACERLVKVAEGNK